MQQVEKEQTIIKYVLSKIFSILLEKHLGLDETKFGELFKLVWDQFNYALNLVEKDIKTNPSIKIRKPITAAEKI